MRALFSLFLLVPLLGACVEPARVEGMTGRDLASASVTADPTVAGTVVVGSVIGGTETNALYKPGVDAVAFQEALEQSLADNGLLGDPAMARFNVEANVYDVRQPWVHLEMEQSAVAIVQYRVYHKADSSLWFSQDVHSTGSASFGDAILGIHQRRVAVEKAMAANIDQFVSLLMEKLGRPLGT
jgi:hypothetical protein